MSETSGSGSLEKFAAFNVKFYTATVFDLKFRQLQMGVEAYNNDSVANKRHDSVRYIFTSLEGPCINFSMIFTDEDRYRLIEPT